MAAGWSRCCRAEPGILADPVRELCCTGLDQAGLTVTGIHLIQEDSGPEIGQSIAAWLRQLAR